MITALFRGRAKQKGSVQAVSMGVIVTIVALFVGIFMISQVADVTEINNTSDFYTTYSNLVTNTGTIYNILVLVLIIVGLAVAIAYLSGFGRGETARTAV
ncbi:MAG TPA: hypothetical protein EYP89_01555 [Candidatus Omnitrophica bacterium]|nr:hypothetical protein [Candidatus Omnitrophota bacterium]